MADFNITISNRLNCFGSSPSDKWGAWNWNAFTWGEGTADLIVLVNKIIVSEVLTLTESWTKSLSRIISEVLTVTADMGSEGLKNGDWSYVFVSNTTEAENRDPTTWASGSAGSTTWTSAAAGSTTWS